MRAVGPDGVQGRELGAREVHDVYAEHIDVGEGIAVRRRGVGVGLEVGCVCAAGDREVVRARDAHGDAVGVVDHRPGPGRRGAQEPLDDGGEGGAVVVGGRDGDRVGRGAQQHLDGVVARVDRRDYERDAELVHARAVPGLEGQGLRQLDGEIGGGP